MKVFILAGGQGVRIRARFPDRPKALIPVLGKPFLEWQLELLIGQRFRDYVFCVGHLSEQIIRHFGNGAGWDINIEYSIETRPLGTAGALKNAAHLFGQTSLVLNGDTYFATDYRALMDKHDEQCKHTEIVGSLGLVTVPDPSRYGQVLVDPDHRVAEFREKSAYPQASPINAGAYVFEPGLLDYIPAGQVASLERDTFPTLAAAGLLCGVPIKGSFVDMGTPEGYRTLVELLR